MTALGVICALVAALCIGYWFGRRTGLTPPTWKQRTSRTALSRRAMSLMVLMIARRLQRRLPADRAVVHVLAIWAVKFVEPLELLRGSLGRHPNASSRKSP